MIIISTSMGFILVLPNKESLKETIKHFQGQLEWIEKENVDPPYLYGISDDRIGREDIEDLLQRFKGQFEVKVREE